MSEDIEKEFWDLRKRIYFFRNILIIQCIGGLTAQLVGLAIFGQPWSIGLLTFGMITFATGIFFLYRSNQQIRQVNRQGDRIFGEGNW